MSHPAEGRAKSTLSICVAFAFIAKWFFSWSFGDSKANSVEKDDYNLKYVPIFVPF